jgi:hypothetical protein
LVAGRVVGQADGEPYLPVCSEEREGIWNNFRRGLGDCGPEKGDRKLLLIVDHAASNAGKARKVVGQADAGYGLSTSGEAQQN